MPTVQPESSGATTAAEGVVPPPRVAIVTGGGRGIGQATAIELARAGTAVTVAARSAAQVEETVALIEQEGGRAQAISLDVSDPDAVAAAVAASAEAFGPCDLLVNVAGINGPIALVGEIELTDWDSVLGINLTGTFLMARAVLPGMVQAGGGRILNTISGLATRVQPGLSAYSATKAAVAQFTAVLAEEYADQGIRAFAVNPGIVRTTLLKELIDLPNADTAQSAVTSRMHSEAVNEMLVSPETSARLFAQAARGDLDSRSGQVLSVYDPELTGATAG